ncbi:MAG: hypothetical protein JO247_02725, partial [Chloroflexi bacterium]|nr:hypothetical protein [Chloroflexota bacterium]
MIAAWRLRPEKIRGHVADEELAEQAALDAQVARLGQFLRYNIPLNVVISGAMLALWYFTQFWAVLAIAGLVAAYTCLLAYGRWHLRRGHVTATVLCIALGAIGLVVTCELLSASTVLPTLALLTLWPVMLALPYLKKRAMVSLMAVSTAAAAVLSALTFTGDVTGVMRHVPTWVPQVMNAFCMPVFVGFICLVVWHYGSRLENTVHQLRSANVQLHQSERILE